MRGLAFVLTLVLCGCATSAPLAVNAEANAANPAPPLAISPDGDVIVLALSGGGARAASFSLGVMQALRDTPARDGRRLIDHVSLITSVSGGSIAAAYIGQHGPAGLDTFRAAYLDKNWDRELHVSPASPRNWFRAWRGGLNDERLLADWLDREVFTGARMEVFGRDGRPQVWLNAADLYNGVPFAFTPQNFDAICSNLATTRVADAAAASMAVPVVFEPILIEPRRTNCPPPPSWIARAHTDRAQPHLVRAAARALQSYRDPALPYLHLVDGGVIDNLGLSSLSLARLTAGNAYAPLSPQDAVRLTRFSVIVVNAELIRDTQWQTDARAPGGGAVLGTTFDITIESANRASYDMFRTVLAQWRTDLVAWRCGLSADERARLGAPNGWHCDDVVMAADMIAFADLDDATRRRLGVMATRVSLPAEDIDALIAGGRAGLDQNALAQSLRR